jgi:hypothetical protein
VNNGLYVIDTVAAITAVHQAFLAASQMPEGVERERLIAHAEAAFSACTYYIRYPRVQAKRMHYDSVQQLLATLAIHLQPMKGST